MDAFTYIAIIIFLAGMFCTETYCIKKKLPTRKRAVFGFSVGFSLLIVILGGMYVSGQLDIEGYDALVILGAGIAACVAASVRCANAEIDEDNAT